MSDNLFEKFASVFAGRAGQSILDTETGRSCAWREADEQSARMAACLAAAGAKPGDRITAQVGKSPENVFLYLLDPTNIGQEFRGPHTSPIATSHCAGPIG